MPVKASFRGVEFSVVSCERTGGRRQNLHAVAFEDTGSRANDVGRAPRQFRFNAIILGRNYRVQRDKLIDALETKGPGVLVHPEFGRLLCHASDRMRERESTSRLDCAEFEFTLEEAADQQVQRTRFAPLGAVKKQKLAGVSAAAKVFETRIGYPAVSDFIATARLDTIDNVLADLRSINGAIGSVLSVPSGYAAQIDALSSNLAALLSTPARVFSSVVAIADGLAQAVTRVLGPAGLEANGNVLSDYFGQTSRTSDGASSLLIAGQAAALLGSDTPEVPDVDTPERDTQMAERSVILSTARTALLLSLADAVQDMPLDSTRDIAAVSAGLIEGMIAVADADDTDTTLSDALRGAAAGLSQHLRNLGQGFTTYTPGTPLPAEIIAHILYDDPERADEIVKRNKPANPGACQGFVPLEVRRD